MSKKKATWEQPIMEQEAIAHILGEAALVAQCAPKLWNTFCKTAIGDIRRFVKEEEAAKAFPGLRKAYAEKLERLEKNPTVEVWNKKVPMSAQRQAELEKSIQIIKEIDGPDWKKRIEDQFSCSLEMMETGLDLLKSPEKDTFFVENVKELILETVEQMEYARATFGALMQSLATL